MREFTVLHMFCGIGGGALGFQRSRGLLSSREARFRTLLGVDVDAAACEDFRTLTGAPALCADVSTLTPDELRAACPEPPDVVFTSPPCKGFSGLLSSKRLKEEKYQKLNRLVFQGLWLVLETWPKNPPKLIALENVPRIAQRGADLLAQLRSLLAQYGYRTHEGFHDCGELGGLAQHRRRFLLVARHEGQVPTFVYQPPLKRVRGIGEVLGDLPMPDDPRGGPMHTLPRLQWKTWVRLALIPAGGDWRSLGTRDDGKTPYNNQLRLVPWDAASIAVTAGGTPTAGGVNVADPRFNKEYRRGSYGVLAYDQSSGTVTGEAAASTGSFAFADPRLKSASGNFDNHYGVERWSDPAPTITGATRPVAGAVSVADPRVGREWYGNVFGLARWSDPAGVVTANGGPTNGGICVGDPRIGGQGSRPDLFGVLAWEQPAKTISGHAKVSGSNCPAAVADPRFSDLYRVERWEAPAHTIVGATRVMGGAPSVADPRVPAEDERPDPPPVIIALDGTWHRPLTTWELAALQSLPVRKPDGSPLVLAGRAHTAWRERIGNCVPPDAAEAMGSEFLRALLAADAGATFTLGGTGVWVRDEAEAIAL